MTEIPKDAPVLTPARLAQMRALEEKATKGPWTADNMETREDGSEGCAWGIESQSTPDRMGRIVVLHDFIGPDDAKFCAAARSFIPDALATIERLEGEIETLKVKVADWKKLGDGVTIESERLQVIAGELGLEKPTDRQGYTGPHTAFTIIAALAGRQLATDAQLTTLTGEKARLTAELGDEVIAHVAQFTRAETAEATLAARDTEMKGLREEYEGYRTASIEGTKRLKAEVARLADRLLDLELAAIACGPYLKDGETPAECINRNRKDADAVLSLLAKDRAALAALRGQASVWERRWKALLQAAATDAVSKGKERRWGATTLGAMARVEEDITHGRPRPPRHGGAVTRATWTNGKRSVTGAWEWVWSAQRFVIVLDSRDRMTGEQRRIVTSNDTPEWGNWKRQPATPEST